VCYKPEMRKWMSERLKRRKKEPAKTGAEAPPAPLQPAFYDEQPAKTESVAEETKAPLESEAAQEIQPTEPHMPQTRAGRPESGGNESEVKRRRRRGRGGRGRGRTGGHPTGKVGGVATPVGEEVAPVVAAAPGRRDRAEIPAKAQPPQPSKGFVVLAIGLPGSGKSSWFKRNKITPLSSDLLRVLLFDDPTEQRFQDLIFSNLRSMLKARLIARRPTNYVDATNLSPHERNGWIKLAKDYGYEVHGVFFDVPVEVCLERNQRRERKVPDDAMRRMASKLKPPTFEEGFSKITVVRVKQKEAEAN
jgi:predicted kinase